MKIYQVRKSGGEWSDAFDYEIATYLFKDKAYRHKDKLEKEFQECIDKNNKCINCIFYYDMKIDEYKTKKQAIDKYCNKYNTETDNDYIFCTSITNIFDYYNYRVEEIEVIV